MNKVRLYHLAHDWALPTQSMLEALHEAGHRLKSHFVEVEAQEVPRIRSILERAGLFDVPEPAKAEAPAGRDGDGATATAQAAAAPAAPAAVEAPPATAGEPAAPAATKTAPSAPAPSPAPAQTAAPAAAQQPAAAPATARSATPAQPVQPAARQQQPAAAPAARGPQQPAQPAQPAASAPAAPSIPPRPAGVAAGFRGFAPGFDPSARRARPTTSAPTRGPRPGAFETGRRGGDMIMPGPMGSEVEGRGKLSSRTAVSPTKRGGGKQATRRAGGQAELGRGRRLERRLQERDHWHKVTKKRPKRTITANVVRPEKVEIELPISVKDLSAVLAIRIPEMMGFFMKQGMMLNQNQPVPKDAIELICLQYNIECKIVDETDLEQELVAQWEADEDEANLEPRQPIVAVLGHVDHGKTTLLDTIRQTKSPVAAQEAGGITQHIGAYVAEHAGKAITFIDTPGHEAFTEMRARGANVTDIVLLVIAADDGVMPQTKEAIQHAQAAGAHIIVALTKIDKPNANKDKVLQQLAQIEGMLPQEFGGETEVVPVSAIKNQGIDALLETITTYAELLELKANPQRAASGTVLEAKKTEGRGIVVTALVQDGTLKKGDNIIAGRSWCRVRMMFNDRGKPVQQAGPGVPVEVLGFDEIPEAGDRFYSISDEDELKQLLAERERRARERATAGDSHIPTDYAGVIKQLADQQVKEVRVILKADTQGSLQVLKAELSKLGNSEVRCRVIRDGVGAITTADVNLAFAERTGTCVIMGFGVIAEAKARALAKERGVNIRTHNVIYDLLNDMKDVMGGALEPEERENVIGMVEIRKVFRSSKLGNIAGCFVEQGVVRRNAHVRLSRDGIVLWQGELASLRRFKDDVREVRENFECGIKLQGYDDIKEGDRLEVFEIERIKRTLE